MLEKHPLRDAPSKRMTHEVDLVEAERLKPGADETRVPVEGIARVRARRLAVARKIEHENPARACEGGSHGKPGAVRITESVQENERTPSP